MITVCLLAKNAAATLEQALDSVASFPEIIVYDNESSDATPLIAARYPNVKLMQGPFIGFGPLRNAVASQATNDWILVLDADERLSPLLLDEIRSLPLSANTIYSFPRRNFYNGKWIRGCGWHPDRVVRLYNRKATSYSASQVHEKVLPLDLQIYRCLHYIEHTPYRSTTEFLAKMQHYSTLFAEQNAGRKHSSFARAFGHAIFTFIRSYFFKKGILLGAEGFVISLYNSNTAFYKYLKLAEANTSRGK
jgi:glycosyltransferase involved in cell wall biosynthesis